jgi:recombination protein U
MHGENRRRRRKRKDDRRASVVERGDRRKSGRSVSPQGKRGMILEAIVDFANKQYLNRRIARIDKIATPVVVTKIIGNKVKDGFFAQKSTVDYVGTLNTGQSVCFDCKQTDDTKKFPLKNVSQHQIDYMRDTHELGGAAFLIIYFDRLDRFFRLNYADLKPLWDDYLANPGKKGFGSIPIERLKMEISRSDLFALHYLAGLV